MTTAELRSAARRLALPGPQTMTVNEAREARECIGCKANYKRNIRIVHAIHGCPAHSFAPAPSSLRHTTTEDS